MKEGRYCRIPERPADVERLWHEGKPLALADLPGWISPAEAGFYRYLGSASLKDLSATEKTLCCQELQEVEGAGILVDLDGADPFRHHLYVMRGQEYVWSIGVYFGDSPLRFAPSPQTANPILTGEDVSDVPASFVADPFLLREGRTWYLFFEVLNRRAGKGEIGLATSENGMEWTYRQIVLTEAFHLSYPYTFAWRGDYFLIPESYQAGAVRLYKARRFPTEWEFVGNLLEGTYLVDASVFRHDGRWWLFTETDAGGANDTLRLFGADALTGPWREHPKSPVVQGNPRAARPAGRILVGDGKITRYAQCCYPFYGTDVRAFEITRLTTTDYQEQEAEGNPVLQASGAGWNACGMHHLDAHPTGDGRWIACVDGWAALPSI